jgi:hypothetical protein
MPRRKRTQKTPKGYEIPVPKREDVQRAMRKLASPAAPLRDRGRDRTENA